MDKITLSNDTLELARNRMHSFFSDMNAWELICARLARDIDSKKMDRVIAKSEIRTKFEAIMLKHASQKAKHDRTADDTYTYSEPPEYEPALEPIESIQAKGKRIIVRTKQLHRFKNNFIYTLVNELGELRILDRKYETFDGKLAKYFL